MGYLYRFVATVGLAVAVVSPVGLVAVAVESPRHVTSDVETTPVLHTGDAADDPAIWVDPQQPQDSLVIANDKQGSLEVYNLDGSLRQRVSTATARWGNVDVRQQVRIGALTTDVVASLNGGLRVFTVDPSTRLLASIADGTGALAVGAGEGFCLYDSASTGRVYGFVITRAGRVRQYELDDPDADGLIQVSKVREFAVGSEAEGCVADDASGTLYISQEDVGLWRYGAEPGDASTRVAVDDVSASGHLVSDIEGVTLIETGSTGYLVASAQNVAKPKQSYFVLYDRVTNAYVASFRIDSGRAADGCQRTDGITAYAGDLGPSFPQGMFVCQDNANTAPGTGYQDFKFTRLESVVDLS